jgi:hypothetical protein
VKILKKDEFMKMIEECNVPKNIDQKLLDEASVMMTKWGEGLVHVGADKDHLFKHYGLMDKPEDSEPTRKEKAALRCVASKIFKSELPKEDAVGIMKNFNKINQPGFRWLQ